MSFMWEVAMTLNEFIDKLGPLLCPKCEVQAAVIPGWWEVLVSHRSMTRYRYSYRGAKPVALWLEEFHQEVQYD